MDRREALKKLAVGGAIAAGGSMVLSSNAVAATNSGLPPGLPAGALLSYSNAGGRARFTIDPLPGAISAQFQWRLNRAILESRGEKTFTLSDQIGVVVQTVDIKGKACGPPCSATSARAPLCKRWLSIGTRT